MNDMTWHASQDELSLADIANEKKTKRQVHRATPGDRPEHFKESSAAPKKATVKATESFLKKQGSGGGSDRVEL